MAKTLNTDIVGYVARVDRFLNEVMNAASSNTSHVKEADLLRLKSYLSGARSYLDHISNEPELDLPETNPKEYVLPEAPVMKQIENESLADCCRLLELCRFEAVHSQTSLLSSGVIAFDKERQVKIIEKAERFISDYIEQVTPFDLPETSPKRELTGQGKLNNGSLGS